MSNENSSAINLGNLLTEKKLTREDCIPQLSGLDFGFKACPPELCYSLMMDFHLFM